jgi:hypothetical protein
VTGGSTGRGGLDLDSGTGVDVPELLDGFLDSGAADGRAADRGETWDVSIGSSCWTGSWILTSVSGHGSASCRCCVGADVDRLLSRWSIPPLSGSMLPVVELSFEVYCVFRSVGRRDPLFCSRR